jgi:RimJ/RimL family protein N-acetyltransferase
VTDEEVQLRPLRDDEDVAVFERMNDPEQAGEYNWRGFRDVGDVRRRLAADGLLGPDGGTLLVWRGDERLGFVVWRKLPTGPTSYCWSIGIGLFPEARGKGYGTAAQRLLAEYLFAHTPVNRVEADTEVTNLGEQRALEKAGFTREGVLRGVNFRNGRYRDLVLFSVLRDEVELPD